MKHMKAKRVSARIAKARHATRKAGTGKNAARAAAKSRHPRPAAVRKTARRSAHPGSKSKTAKSRAPKQHRKAHAQAMPARGMMRDARRILKIPPKALVYEEEGVIVRLSTQSGQKRHGPEKREPVEHISVEDVKKAIHEAVGVDLQDIDKEFQVKKQCIVCGAAAMYRIKARPSDTYCKDCALEYFKFLSYLEKI